MLLLTGKSWETLFSLPERRISRHFFQIGSLVRNQNSRMFITFFSSEGRDKFEHQHHEGPGARLRFWIFPLPRSRPCTERIPLILLQLFGWDCHGDVCSHSQQRPRPYIRSQKVSSLKTELLTAHLATARKTPFKIWCIVIFKEKKELR